MEWIDCSIPKCTNKVCTWGSESLCYPHEERIVGKAEMDRRYNATHERTWDAPTVPNKPNYMLKEFSEIEAD